VRFAPRQEAVRVERPRPALVVEREALREPVLSEPLLSESVCAADALVWLALRAAARLPEPDAAGPVPSSRRV
jgi:hypothetical protein